MHSRHPPLSLFIPPFDIIRNRKSGKECLPSPSISVGKKKFVNEMFQLIAPNLFNKFHFLQQFLLRHRFLISLSFNADNDDVKNIIAIKFVVDGGGNLFEEYKN